MAPESLAKFSSSACRRASDVAPTRAAVGNSTPLGRHGAPVTSFLISAVTKDHRHPSNHASADG